MINITLPCWETPESYYGFNPVGDYCIYARNRDSSILTNSNFEGLEKILMEVSNNLPAPEPRFDEQGREMPSSWVYTFSASCWAHGWREYLMLRHVDAGPEGYDELVQQANALVTELRDIYPILDEDDYWERQDAAMTDYWNSLSIEERVALCKDHDESIFSARADYPPANVRDSWSDSGEFS